MGTTMKLTIVIPALDEEEAIGSTIERCLAARDRITAESPVTEVEIIVVSDGSTDRTAEVAGGFPEVRLIVFERNRGYGAAIQSGFAASEGELVGFLDADGTCDPNFFAALSRAVVERNAEIALGCRMGPESRMPGLRRVGNHVYAVLLSALSNRVVRDTASGMRVLRRSALPRLYPLPTGLHFTPAMSARALMDDALRIVEVPMPYEERIGHSKLRPFRDGLRFLRAIMGMTLVWRPDRLFLTAGTLAIAVAVLLVMHPLESWLRRGGFPEDMVYRLLFCFFSGTVGASLISFGVLTGRLRRLLVPRSAAETFLSHLLRVIYSPRGLAAQSLVILPVVAWLTGEGVWTLIRSGTVTIHWSRAALAGALMFAWVQAAATAMVLGVIQFHAARSAHMSGSAEEEAPRASYAASEATWNIPIPSPREDASARTPGTAGA
jgi:hypothetical protein